MPIGRAGRGQHPGDLRSESRTGARRQRAAHPLSPLGDPDVHGRVPSRDYIDQGHGARLWPTNESAALCRSDVRTSSGVNRTRVGITGGHLSACHDECRPCGDGWAAFSGSTAAELLGRLARARSTVVRRAWSVTRYELRCCRHNRYTEVHTALPPGACQHLRPPLGACRAARSISLT